MKWNVIHGFASFHYVADVERGVVLAVGNTSPPRRNTPQQPLER